MQRDFGAKSGTFGLNGSKNGSNLDIKCTGIRGSLCHFCNNFEARAPKMAHY